MARNLSTHLRRKRVSTMAQYDRLPAELRGWLAQARLPWSAQSAARQWQRALHAARGDIMAARAALSQLEERLIARDAMQVWGADHPAAQNPEIQPDRAAANSHKLQPGHRRNAASSSALT